MIFFALGVLASSAKVGHNIVMNTCHYMFLVIPSLIPFN